jgi:membrane-bound inhibitor of C-type lysozyme
MKKSHILTIFTIIVLAIIVYVVSQNHTPTTPSPEVVVPTPASQVAYACDSGKTIQATYYQGESTPSTSPDQPPVPGGSVALTLSDGRSMTLAQTLSADGSRYANPDESFVFWSKGNGALVLENNQQKSYIGCVTVTPDPGSLPQVYQNGTEGISMRYPTGYTVDEFYKYQALGPGKDIYGTKFTIPASVASGTNLGSDSYISIEQIPKAKTCSASLFLSPGAKVSILSDAGTDYSYGTSADAGAGNRYDETVYALPGTNPCTAIRYYIHYAAIENYPTGAVKEFDEQALTNQFDQIRQTLVVNQ